MNIPRRAAASLFLLPFLVQSTGAADIARLMGPAAASRAVLLPPPGRHALPPSAAPRPAPGRWSADARAVGAWAYERVLEAFAPPAPPPARLLPRPSTLPSLPPEPVAVAAGGAAVSVESAAPAGPFADRILIRGGSGVIGAYGELESPFSEVLPMRFSAYTPRFTGFWSRGDGVSLRVDYLRPWGVNKADAEGFTLLFKGRSPHRIRAPGGVPPLLRREHPVYFAGDVVTVELTLRNDGAAPLRGLSVLTRQEGLMLDGSAGPALDRGSTLEAAELAPGAELTLRWTITMSRRGTAAVNFEQTAVKVVGEDGKVYANVNQAGIVDPPAP